MPGPRRTLAEYVADRISQFSSLGAVVRSCDANEFPADVVIHAVLSFGESGLMQVYEHIRIDTGRPHRFKYGYRCSDGTDFLFRYDRDPTGHPEMPEHKHVAGSDRRFPCGRVTLHDVADEFWAVLADRAPVEDPIQ